MIVRIGIDDMKTKVSLNGRWAKYEGNAIFTFDGVSEVFYEYDSEEYALKVWMEVIEKWSKKPTYTGTKTRMTPDEILGCICENNENSKHLISWP